MEPNLFGDLIVSRPVARLRRWIWPTSLVAHFVLIAAFVIAPILGTDDLPTPSTAVRAFFVTPLAITPPLPPPPPRATSRLAATLPVQALAARLTAPAEIPGEIPDPAVLDLGIEGGAPGGVEGGVAGGVVGGIVGGLVASEPSAGAQRMVSFVTEPHKLRMVAPVYPEVARRAHVQGAVVLALVVDKRGLVADINVVNSASPLLNEAAIEAARQWIYAPTLVDGVPVRLLLQVTVTFSLSSSA
jgi:periplasmic protein TonB